MLAKRSVAEGLNGATSPSGDLSCQASRWRCALSLGIKYYTAIRRKNVVESKLVRGSREDAAEIAFVPSAMASQFLREGEVKRRALANFCFGPDVSAVA